MPLDAVFLTAVLDEINPYCNDSRIDKVQQPEKDKIILSLRGRQGNKKLLLCARPGSARLHFSQQSYENPISPPMFCMLLRKHLAGARITEIYQTPMERMVRFSLTGYDELGEGASTYLILELMGRNANIILTDSDGIIIDALRRVDEDISRSRMIQPGLRYVLPPQQQGKLRLDDIEFNVVKELFYKADAEIKITKWLLDTFLGLSPLVCRELADMGSGVPDARIFELTDEAKLRFLTALEGYMAGLKAHNFLPFMLKDNGIPYDYSYMEIRQYAGKMTGESYESFSELLEDHYTLRDREDRLKQRAGALIKSLTTVRDRAARKAENQQQELADAALRERNREIGDIITANLHQMKKGEAVLRAQDFYSLGGESVDIKLDELKTPQQNAAMYYKKYNKAKTAEKHLKEQTKKAEEDRDYLSSVLEAIGRADAASDIAEIRSELVQTGFLRESKGKKKTKEPPSRPLSFTSSDGFEILVGKNNLQNDKLTFKTAMRSDIWLHAQKIHGSHGVIRCAGADVPERTLEEAATIIAGHSQCVPGQKVPVDFTLIRHVKRQPSGKPGMVFYTEHKTVYAMPDKSLEQGLKGG